MLTAEDRSRGEELVTAWKPLYQELRFRLYGESHENLWSPIGCLLLNKYVSDVYSESYTCLGNRSACSVRLACPRGESGML